MYRLEHPEYWIALIAIPIMVVAYWSWLYWRRRSIRRFADTDLFQRLAPHLSLSKYHFKFVLLSLALIALVVALVNPRVGSELETVKRKGVDIVFALDVSKSMLAEDVQPNRLEKARQLIYKVLDELRTDRIGIIVYAGQAFPQLPITTDYAAARMFMRSVNTDIITSQGTAIADAIELSRQYFDDEDQKNRLLFVISDGEDHEEGVLESAEIARQEGIRIHTVGVGTRKGGPIPEKVKGRLRGYKKDRNGQTVITRMDEDGLIDIASAGDGTFVHAYDTRVAVEHIVSTIEEMEKAEIEERVFSDYKDQFQWFLGLALLLLLIEWLVPGRKTYILEKLGIVKE
jgi:Ca-activated chloride channel family protein